VTVEVGAEGGGASARWRRSRALSFTWRSGASASALAGVMPTWAMDNADRQRGAGGGGLQAVRGYRRRWHAISGQVGGRRVSAYLVR
jgi:hypothetical protein